MVRATSARPRGARPAVPAKITSSILPPRRLLAPCSPMTQERASTTLDLPEPLGPTTHVMPGSKRKVVAEAKDLNPRRVRLFRCTLRSPPPVLPAASAVTGKVHREARGVRCVRSQGGRRARRGSGLCRRSRWRGRLLYWAVLGLTSRAARDTRLSAVNPPPRIPALAQ